MATLFSDIKKHIPSYNPAVIFDVGANVGQTISGIRKVYQETKIFAFEPVPESFEVLSANNLEQEQIKCFNYALGRSKGTANMSVNGTSTANKIVGNVDRGSYSEVSVIDGDSFCRSECIDHISILKIDTEGHDLDVLIGFRNMIADQNIDFIQVEASMNATNRRHIAQARFHGFLEPFGYMLFRIYDQAFETKNRPLLRRTNLAFVSSFFVNLHQRNS